MVFAYLSPEVILRFEAENLRARDVEGDKDVLETRPVPRLAGPTLFDEQLEAVGAAFGDGQLQAVGADAPDDGVAVDVLVGHFAREQLPQADAERPDVNLLKQS